MRRMGKWKEDNKSVTEVKELCCGVSDLWLSAASLSLPPLDWRLGGKKSKMHSAHRHTRTHMLLSVWSRLLKPDAAKRRDMYQDDYWSPGSDLSWLTVKMSLWLNTLTSQPHSLFTFSLVDGESCTAPVAHNLLCHFTPLFLQESFKSVYYLSALHSLVCLALELQSVGGDSLKYRYKPPSGLNFDTGGSVSHFSLLALCFKTETLSLSRTVWKSPAKWCTGKPVEISHRRVLTLKRPFLQWTPGLKVIRQDC